MFCTCQDDDIPERDLFPCQNPNCSQFLHLNCHNLDPKLFTHFECPSCILKYGDPSFQILKILHPPTYLNPTNSLEFELSSFDHQLLSLPENSNHFLMIRCIKLVNDPYTIHYDMWPKEGTISLNKTNFQLDDFIDKQSKRLVFYRFLKRDETKEGTNTVNIEVDTQDEENYYFGIYLVRKNTVDNLKVLVENSWRMSPDDSKKLIQSCLSIKKKQKSMTVSVTDEQGELIETPVRAKGCRHITCFSLEKFLAAQIDGEIKRWNCPICKNRAYHLVIDEYFLKIISKYRGKKLQKYNVTFYSSGIFEVSAGITKGNSDVNAIQIEDYEPPENKSYLATVLNVIKEALKTSFINDGTALTIPSFKIIEAQCMESGEGKKLTVKELHEIIISLYDPLGFQRKDAALIEIEDSEESEKKNLQKFKSFFAEFLQLTEKIYANAEFLKEALGEIEALADKFEARFELELSILHLIRALNDHFVSVEVSREYLVDYLKTKPLLTSFEQEILQYYMEWMSYYRGKVKRPGFQTKTKSKSKYDYLDFPIEVIKEMEPERFNWALNRVLLTRKDLWTIYWDSQERWYNVEPIGIHKKSNAILVKDPFSGILENDVDLVMEEVMYLKECWKYEMKIRNEIKGVENRVNGGVEGVVEVLAPEVEIEIDDFLGNRFVCEKYLKEFKKEVEFKSLKKGQANLRKFAQEFKLDSM